MDLTPNEADMTTGSITTTGHTAFSMGDTSFALAASNSVANPPDVTAVWTDSFDDFTNICDIDLPGLGPLGINWISPGYRYDLDWDIMPNSHVVASQVHNVAEHVPCTSDGMPQSNNIGTRIEASSSTTAQSPHSVGSAMTPRSSGREYYVAGDGARAPFGGRCRGRGSDNHGQSQSLITTGTPREISQSSGSTDLCSVEAYDHLIENCNQEAHFNQLSLDRAQLPSHPQIELYVQHYFDKFSPILPFLRRASFKEVESRHWQLLLAVATMGSLYEHSCQELHRVLLALLGAALRQHQSRQMHSVLHTSDDDFYSPGQQLIMNAPANLQILQATILHFVCLLKSGKRSLIDKALSLRPHLVEMCNSLRLLDPAVDDECNNLSVNPGSRLQDWLCRESSIRTGMVVWVLKILVKKIENSLTRAVP